MFLVVVAPLMGFSVVQLFSVSYATQCGMGALSMQFDRSYIFLLSGRSLQIHACLSDYERCERIFTITFIHAYLYC